MDTLTSLRDQLRRVDADMRTATGDRYWWLVSLRADLVRRIDRYTALSR